MRRPLIVSALLAAAIALTGCSTGASAQDAGVSDKSAEVLSVANIDKVVASDSGDVSTLPATFGEPTKRAAKIGWSSPRTANGSSAASASRSRRQSRTWAARWSATTPMQTWAARLARCSS